MRRGSLTEGGNTMSLLSPLSGGAVQGDHHYETSTVDRSQAPRVYISTTASDFREMARHLDMEAQWYSGITNAQCPPMKEERNYGPEHWDN